MKHLDMESVGMGYANRPNKMKRLRQCMLAGLVAVSTAFADFAIAPVAHASEVRVIVNNEVVTSYDIARRVAFLRLQRRSGNLNSIAEEQLTEEALKRSAISRAGIRIPDRMVDSAFANFARNNNLSASQLTTVLNQAGVTTKHFKEFIRNQIGWGQTVAARERATGSNLMSEQDVVAKMLEQGGPKPTSTEYILQQVILVVPQNARNTMGARVREANNLRARLQNCEQTRTLAQGLRDVAVRDLGRRLELELPGDWKDFVSGLQTGQTTRVRETPRGAEFILVCRARTVSDDRVAQLEFSTQALEDGEGGTGADFLEELRENARIERR
ncbi:MAG: SurA N-terminal domain-containing protein [Pseudomonadota bacterium]